MAERNGKFFFTGNTDKSVKPICIYGVSKLLAEELVLNEGENNHKFLVVRFGNVIGTKGSIIPKFKQQIIRGGPVTITHKDVTRYFITIDEAVSLVLKIGGIGKGNELYILDMGDPIKIVDVAKQVMRFLNNTAPFEFTGLRRGDKLHESLWDENKEKLVNTRYRGIMKVERLSKLENTDIILEKLKPICFFDSTFSNMYRRRDIMKGVLKEAFPTLETFNYEPEY